MLVPVYKALGSSPRMRGALTPALGGDVAIGIIPAYAGSTFANEPHDIYI